jgi:TRAP-type C4-dicarboxylate transport system substrate-binding protein
MIQTLSEGGQAAITSIRLCGYQPAMSVHTRAMQHVVAAIRRHGGPDIPVDFRENVTISGQLASDLPKLIESGAMHIGYFSSSYLAGRVPALQKFDRPFPSPDRSAIFADLDGALGAQLANAVAAATGFRVLAYWDNGLRHISNSRRPIRSPDDCAGLKIRTTNNAFHQSVFRSLGFEPIWIDVADLPAAVELGVVDAQENPLTNLVNFGLHRHQCHISLTGHFFGVSCVLVNRAAFDAWPAEIRRLITTSIADATPLQRQMAASEDARCLAILAASGCKIIGREELDIAAFKARCSASLPVSPA